MEPFHREELENGLVLEFRDLSNRYFGDYHRLHVEVRCRIALADTALLTALPSDLLEQARRLFGANVDFSREMTRMGVAGGELEDARRKMVEDFLCSSSRYLADRDFPARYVRQKIEDDRKKKRFIPRVL